MTPNDIRPKTLTEKAKTPRPSLKGKHYSYTATVTQDGTIELQTPQIPEGTKVEVMYCAVPEGDASESSSSDSKVFDNEVPESNNTSTHPLAGLTPEEAEAKVMSVLGAWEGNQELDDLFANIDHERHGWYSRPIPFIDD